MELFKYYNLTESSNPDIILIKLEELYDELKIDYQYYLNEEVFKIEDLDLTESELKDIQKLFEDNDVLPDLDCGRNDEDDIDLMGFNEDYDF